MIITLWFVFVVCVILVGFSVLGLTFRHWYKQKKAEQEPK